MGTQFIRIISTCWLQCEFLSVSIKYFLNFSYNAKKIHLTLKLILKISDTYVFDPGGSQYNALRPELFFLNL